MGNYFENAKTIQEKRSILKQLSEPIKVLVKMGQIECIKRLFMPSRAIVS